MCSPLRYPGGKSCLLELTVSILNHNDLLRGHYAEPFAGGCGLALSLLYGGYVAEIHINDIDFSIWSFWNSVINRTDEFIELVETTPVTIEEWHRQREIQRTDRIQNNIEYAFSTFFLNRTNRSGVIKGGGVIGGLNQSGQYKIDCRFNTADLIKRIRRVARYRDRIHLSNSDALIFLDDCDRLPERSFLFIDPPYYKKGPGLYTSYYKSADHAVLANRIDSVTKPWIVTYDDVPEIRSIYNNRQKFCFDIKYSLNEKRTGTELLIAADSLQMPPEACRKQIDRRPRAIAA